MPQSDTTRGNAGKSTRGARRKAKRTPPKRTPPAKPIQRGHAGEGGKTIAPRNRRPTPLPPSTVPQNIFGGPVFSAEQERAAQKVSRARKRLPEPPLPAIPTLRNPTRKQQRAAAQLVQKAIVNLAGGRDVRRQSEVMDALMSDPRSLRRLAPVNRAAAARLERMFAAQAQRAGYGGSRAQRAQIGQALAMQDTVKPGVRKRIGLPGASIEFNPAALRSVLAAVTSLEQGDSGPRQFVSRVGSDLKTLGTAPFVGAVSLGQGVSQAVRTGQTDQLEDMVVEAAKGTVETFKHPIKSFEQNPLLTALTFGGATSVAGRVGGAAARGAGKKDAGGVRGALDRVGTTVRPPIALVDDPGLVRNGQGLVERSYSKDLTRKAAQEAKDSRREPLRDAEGKVVTVKQRGRDVPVLKATTREREGGIARNRAGQAGRQADFEAARANAVERHVRQEADRELKGRGVKGKRGRDAVALVVEGTVRSAKSFEKDLRSHRAKLEREYRARIGDKGFRNTGEAQANRQRVAQITALLKTSPNQREAIVAAGKAVGQKLNERERGLVKAGVLSSGERAKRARLIPAAIEHLGARYDPETDTIRGPKAQRLTTEAMERGLRQVGVDPDSVAYLPHRMDVRGGRAFHAQFRPGTRPVMDKAEKRTGEAYRKGATVASADLIREQGVRQSTQLAKAQQLDRLVENTGLRHPDGERLWTWKEAEELTDRIDFDTRTGSPVFVMRNGQRMVPMRAHAAKLSPDTQRLIRDELQGPGAMETLHMRLLNDRIVHSPDEGRAARNVVLVPAKKVEQLEKHLRPAGQIEKFFQLLNKPFRMAVLPQPRWLTGNFVEPYIVRLTINGSGLNVFGLATDLRAAHKALRSMERSGDPRTRRAAQEIRAQQFGGLFVGGGQARAIRRGLEDFPKIERAYGEMVAKLPATKQAAEMAGIAGRVLLSPLNAFFRMNRVIESGAQRAAFGKQIRRDLQEFQGSWLQTVRLQEKAVAEAARGLVNTPTQERFMRQQHKLLGKYEGFGPVLRAWIQGPMPFLPWALNAARFVYWTMPMEHTALTAALTQVNDVVAKDWEEIHANVPPGGLKFALPTEKGGWVDVARYTPYGLITGGEGTITGQVAPHFQGAIKAIGGDDPFGRQLKVDPRENAGVTKTTGAQNWGIAGYSLAEALVPYLSTARRLREGGGTAYAGSTLLDPDVKPETVGQMSAPRRVFDPFRPTYFGAGPRRAAPSTSGQSRPAPVSPEDAILDRVAEADAAVQAQQEIEDEILRRLEP